LEDNLWELARIWAALMIGSEQIGVRRNMEYLSYFDERTLSKITEQFGFKASLIEY
jgi:hypothetical protein